MLGKGVVSLSVVHLTWVCEQVGGMLDALSAAMDKRREMLKKVEHNSDGESGSGSDNSDWED